MISRRCWWLLLFAASGAFAHEPSRSLVTLEVENETLRGRWDISLRDLEDAVGVDANGDSAVSWGELVARYDEIVAYARPRLRVSADAASCVLAVAPSGVDMHGGAMFAVFELEGRCAAPPRELRLDYDLLFEVDGAHRGIISVATSAGAATGVVSASSRSIELELTNLSAWSTLRRFVVEGVKHILEGYDHLAFVSLLLLPIALGRGKQRAHASPRAVAWEIARVVTAFTAAHSLTLALAASGYVPLPTRFVEVAIAASVLLAAVLNVVPNAPRLGAKLAFAFGLVHGFGFANALGDLSSGETSLLASLAGFNVGVELGQLAVVAGLLPLLFLARRFAVSSFAVNAFGSAACAALAIVWLVERLN